MQSGNRRMGANPHANGGILLRDLDMPDFHIHAVKVPAPGAGMAEDTQILGNFLRDVAVLNQERRNFRIFGPDETLSNLEFTKKNSIRYYKIPAEKIVVVYNGLFKEKMIARVNDQISMPKLKTVV